MNIVVLCGGLSAERDVSISSGTRIASALRELGHKAVLIDLYFGYTGHYKEPGEIFSKPYEETEFSVRETEPDLEKIKASGNQTDGSRIGGNILQVCRAADIVFLALHGEEGENGKLQGMLDLAGIKYTGSGSLGSALAMNKDVSKRLFREGGIHTPFGIVLGRDGKARDNAAVPEFPCVVKPCSGGSSVGTSIVNSEHEYEKALELAFRYESEVLVEQYIKGREFTIGVFDGHAMPVIEIIPADGFYDYKNKYQPGRTLEICPADIDDSLNSELQLLAERAASILMIDVYCRIDVLRDDSGVIYCLEANTLPGMTSTSLIPQMAAASGIDFAQLCQRIIDVSFEKYC